MRIVCMPGKKRSSLGASSAKEKSHLRAEMLSTATASEKKLKEEMLSPTSTYQSGLENPSLLSGGLIDRNGRPRFLLRGWNKSPSFFVLGSWSRTSKILIGRVDRLEWEIQAFFIGRADRLEWQIQTF